MMGEVLLASTSITYCAVASASSSSVKELSLIGTKNEVDFWKEKWEGGWAAIAALLLIFLWQFGFWLLNRSGRWSSNSHVTVPNPATAIQSLASAATFRKSEIISDADLKALIDDLEEKGIEAEKWNDVIDKANNLLSYKAKCCRPKDSPLKYLSTTVFQNCSPEILRDFYMDNSFRKQWDKTFVEHGLLHIDLDNGIEFGWMIKKFPLLTPREYVLAWKVWEGNDQTFYCCIKEHDHPSVARQKKYVRVGFFRSGWRIRKVPGTSACEIKMMHQEDAGMNPEMAKIAFAKGIWSYVCKMESAFRSFSSSSNRRSSSAISAVTLAQKVPASSDDKKIPSDSVTTSITGACVQTDDEVNVHTSMCSSSKKLIANGLLAIGGIACLAHGHTSLGAKVAVAIILKKLSKSVTSSVKAGNCGS